MSIAHLPSSSDSACIAAMCFLYFALPFLCGDLPSNKRGSLLSLGKLPIVGDFLSPTFIPGENTPALTLGDLFPSLSTTSIVPLSRSTLVTTYSLPSNDTISPVACKFFRLLDCPPPDIGL